MNHHHHHDHAPTSYNRAFAIGVGLNLVFVAIEAGYGVYSGSLALIADAGHNLSDVVSLLLAWGANVLATKAATEKHTYGFRKATVMASLASAILLMVVLGGISWEAITRLLNPTPVVGPTVIIVAAIGVVINTVTALLFVKGQKHDLNLRGAFLHMTADAAVSLGVVVAGIFITLKGTQWIDPVISFVIVVVIFIGTWGLFRESINYAIDAVPKSIDIHAIKQYFASLEKVVSIHDLHVWPLSTTQVALTVHVVVIGDQIDDKFLLNIQQHLHDRFGIEHATIQVESASTEGNCYLDRHQCK
ncbi:MAG: cation diffusion facilitator family transporter [Thioalkalispiraceae bacterium]|jgi:cobalt-zinc-cadmium efflux system protein